MEIKLSRKYVMTSDPHNFILNEVVKSKSGKSKGQTRLVAVGFYPSIEQLVDGLLTKTMRASSATSLEELIAEHNSLVGELRSLIKRIKE